MNKVVFFENECSGKVYFDFLDYAFSKNDYFMLVYINYQGKGYSYNQKRFRALLEKFKIKSKTEPVWPGATELISSDTKYKIIFYKTTDDAKEILKQLTSINDWCGENPSDLSFFNGEFCWFYSVAQLKIAAIIKADNADIDFAIKNGLAEKSNVFTDNEKYTYKESGLI